jgi:hypothetical protein
VGIKTAGGQQLDDPVSIQAAELPSIFGPSINVSLDKSTKMDYNQDAKDSHDVDDASQSIIAQPTWTDDEEKAVVIK